jgi:hypothetical protein
LPISGQDCAFVPFRLPFAGTLLPPPLRVFARLASLKTDLVPENFRP